jgi:hypothetical protein
MKHQGFILICLLLMNCASYTYVEETRQAGLTETITPIEGCQITKIDTLYNPMGGVIKKYTTRCRIKNK